ENNTFINNEIAVQVLSFNNFVTDFWLRINDCNFFGNGVDFDVQTDATLYFYRNYFGDWNPNQSKLNLNALASANTHSAVFKCLQSRAPQITSGNAAVTVHTNPRWFYPVQNWWACSAKITDVFGDYDCLANAKSLALASEETDQPAAGEEEPYVNYLTADWEKKVVLLNTEAASLQLDIASLDSEEEKTLDVVDENENLLGTWTFKGSKTARLAGEEAAKFNPYLDVQKEKGALVVTTMDSALLASEQPLLTIPCGDVDWSCVQVTGPDGQSIFVQWDKTANAVSFTVEAGGTYRIEKAELMAAAHNPSRCTVTISAETQLLANRVIVASYDAEGRFLGLTIGTENIKLAYEKDAATIGVFLTDGLTAMRPQAQAARYTVK
ncbi:MAG: hypothetical protein J6J51_02440, partial [Clostridia bacterium]|nr:hypothetical protein [Clostridia bacterium]